GLLVRIARQIPVDVPVALRRALGLRHTGAVDTLADDRDRLLELLGGDRRLLVDLRLEDDRRAALEVEGELGRPGRRRPDRTGAHEEDECGRDGGQPDEGQYRARLVGGGGCGIAVGRGEGGEGGGGRDRTGQQWE